MKNSLTHFSTPQCLEELDLSMNPLGDGVSESLSCLLSCCPLLAKLSLHACGLTARFLQHHRLLLASALTGSRHKRQRLFKPRQCVSESTGSGENE